MANGILINTGTATAMGITLATRTAGSSRQTDEVDNSSVKAPAALIYAQITSGAAAPTAGGLYKFYLGRSDGTIADDGAGASDADRTQLNTPLLGTIVVTNDAAKIFYGVFDTVDLGVLGTTWFIIMKNATDQSTSTVESESVIRYTTYNSEVQ